MGNQTPDFSPCVLPVPRPELQANGLILFGAPMCLVSTLFNITFVGFIHVAVFSCALFTQIDVWCLHII